MPRNYEQNQALAETPDPTPIELPLGRDRPQSMKDEIMEQVKAMIAQQKEEVLESVEEFWDLEIPEDKDPLESAYELEDMVEEYPTLIEEPETAPAASVGPTEAGTEPPKGSTPPVEGGSQSQD